MRLASAHLLALAAYLGGLYCCFAFILGYAGSSLLNFKFDFGAFPFAALYMMFIGPFAVILMLIYFGLLRARALAIAVLLVLSIALGFAFTDHAAFMKVVVWLDQKDTPLPGNRTVALFRQWMSEGEGHMGIGILWAGVTAAFAHHLVYAALRPRVTKESVSHG